VQPGQIGTGIDAELLGQLSPGRLESRERLCPLVTPVQDQHLLGTEPLAQRVRRGKFSQLPASLWWRPAARSASIRRYSAVRLASSSPAIRPASAVSPSATSARARPRHSRSAAPSRSAATAGSDVRHPGPGLGQRHESLPVELARLGVEQVARRLGADRDTADAGLPDCPAQRPNIGLQVRLGGTRRCSP